MRKGWAALGCTLALLAVVYELQRRQDLTLEVTARPDWRSSLIHGFVAPGWEKVKQEFENNFEKRDEVGAGVAVYFRGEKVVDLWGGFRDRESQAPWEEDTMVNVFSSSKGAASFATLIQLSRGKLQLDGKVGSHWPAFAQNGKAEVAVRHLLGHECGLAVVNKPISLEVLADPVATYDAIAEQEMEWPVCGDRHGYMGQTLGFYEGALVHMTDEKRRSLGVFLRDEVLAPLNLTEEMMFGVPDSVPDRRLAMLQTWEFWQLLFNMDKMPGDFVKPLVLSPSSYASRAFKNPPELGELWRYNTREFRRLQLPASNAHSTARALARLYSAAERAINTDGKVNPLGLSKEILATVQEVPPPSRETGYHDQILQADSVWQLGFGKPPPQVKASSPIGNFGSDSRAFGTAGAGGSFSFADPAGELSFSYVMSKMQQFLSDDPREVALRARAWECANAIRKKEGLPPLRAQEPSPVTKAWLAKNPEQDIA